MKNLLKIILFCVLFWNSASGQPNWNIEEMGEKAYWDIPTEFIIEGTLLYISAGKAGLRIVEVSDAANPQEIGVYDTPGEARDLALNNDYVYIAQSEYGVAIIDVSNPYQPIIAECIDNIGTCLSVDVSQNYLYAVANSDLFSFDVTQPENPLQIGQMTTPGFPIEYIYIHNNVGYGVFSGMFDDKYMYVVDISNPANMYRASLIPGSNYPYDIAFATGYGYLLGQINHLKIYDMADPLHPALISNIVHTGEGKSIAVEDNYAYIAAFYGGLLVMNVTDPQNPVTAASCGSAEYAVLDEITGDAVMTADRYFGLKSISVANPANPQPLGELRKVAQINDVCIAGDYAFAGEEYRGLMIFNIEDTANPIEISTCGLPVYDNNARGICIKDSLVYLASGNYGLRIIDVTDVDNPEEIAAMENLGFALDVEAADDYVFVASGYDGIFCIDAANPEYLILTDAYNTLGYAEKIYCSGDIVYVADGSCGTAVLDASDAANLELITYIDTPSYTAALARTGDLLFVLDRVRLIIYHAADLLNPIELSAFDLTGSYGQDLKIRDNYVIIAQNPNSLRVIEVSNPAMPREVGYYFNPGAGRGLAALEEEIVLADYCYLGIYDYSNCLSSVVVNNANPADDYEKPRASPNPFNASTLISFSLKENARVNIGVYNSSGQEIAKLFAGSMTQGQHEVVWNAESGSRHLSSGIYFCQMSMEYLNTNESSLQGVKIILLK